MQPTKRPSARLILESPGPEARCCFCYGLFEASYCVLADQQRAHKDCLSPLLKALETPDLDLHLPDGTLEKIKGYQAAQLWPR